MKEDWEIEVEKCRDSHYYFATTYLYITDKNGNKHKFETLLMRNNLINNLK